ALTTSSPHLPTRHRRQLREHQCWDSHPFGRRIDPKILVPTILREAVVSTTVPRRKTRMEVASHQPAPERCPSTSKGAHVARSHPAYRTGRRRWRGSEHLR